MAERRRFEGIHFEPDQDRPESETMQLVFVQSVFSQAIRLEPADLLELQRVVDAKVTELDGSQS